jgi:Uma2 family endonuclease
LAANELVVGDGKWSKPWMVAASGVTLDEFSRLEDEKPALEYARGEVFQKPMPTRFHSILTRFFVLVLSQFLERAPLGEVLPEFRCVFGPIGRQRAYVPDVAYVSNERLTSADAFLRTAPDLAIEILSPGQGMARLFDKVEFYLQNGVRLVWIIDPDAATIAVLSPGRESRTLRGDDTLDGQDVLPGFSVPVRDIFTQLRRGSAA